MASTTGLVQKIKLNYDLGVTWVFIGPTTTNTQLFFLQFNSASIAFFKNNEREAAFSSLMVEQLASAMLAQREVTVYHAANDSRISAVELSVTSGLMPP
jgi:hypothetical protein